jgi:thiol:disulfide interchange protein DsbA
MIIRLITSLALALMLPMMSVAQGDRFVEGQHFERLPQAVRVRDSSRIEVVELFWYGCGHCYSFEPVIKQWELSLAEDVDFIRSPAIWAPIMEMHAKAYFVAKNLGVLDRLHMPLFIALNIEGKQLASEVELAQLFARHGVDQEAFSKEFNSFGVGRQIKQAKSHAKSYRMKGTPEVIVNGKYRISSRNLKTQTEMLEVASFLVQKERQPKGSN